MAQVKKAIVLRVGEKGKLKIRPASVFGLICLLALLAFTALPLVYLICTAFKPMDELFVYPPQFFVKNPTMKNFTDLLTSVSSAAIPFARYILNSVFVSVVVVVGTILVSSMGAFSLVKYKPPGSNLIFSVVVAVLTFSSFVTTIPSYKIINELGLMNSYLALILPKIAVAYNFFLMKQFIEQFPDEVLEAARIDGSGEGRIFWTIVMPNVKPAWATLAVLTFVSTWNDYFSPMIYINSQAMRTLPLVLQSIAGGVGTVARSGAMAAATFLTIMPTIIVYVFMQKQVMATMAYSGVKG